MWKEENNALYRKFEFKNFSEAFAFMTRVALEAEKMDHHPRWTNVYTRVERWLNTHDAGDTVTEKDHSLARRIDKLIALLSAAIPNAAKIPALLLIFPHKSTCMRKFLFLAMASALVTLFASSGSGK